jgi:hypothetical protein
MNTNKPRFLEFLKIQNNGFYKLTGIFADSKTGLFYLEKRYSLHKCIIDFILFISYLIIVFSGYKVKSANLNVEERVTARSNLTKISPPRYLRLNR